MTPHAASAPGDVTAPSLTGHRFRLQPGEFAIGRLSPNEPIPAWAWTCRDFVNVTRADDELSVLCRADQMPSSIRAEGGWRLLKLIGPFAFSAVGVLVSFAKPLGDAGVSMLTIATFDTDYILVKADRLERALQALTTAGHVQVA